MTQFLLKSAILAMSVLPLGGARFATADGQPFPSDRGSISARGPSANFHALSPTDGTFTYTGSLTTGREIHTATLLPNGKVLVAGGSNNITGYLTSAELYDPASGSWTATGSLTTARYYHTATLLPSGKVLVAGGSNGGGSLTSAELYDPASGSWSATGSLNTARYLPTATLLPNGKVLVAGGQNNIGGDLTSAELYDPASGSWSATGSLNAARYGHTATLLSNGKVLVAGGYNINSGFLSSAELYDPVSGSWSATGSLNTGRELHTATLLPNGRVLVAGGINDNALQISSAELYDPASGSWSATGSLNAARALHTATLLPNGKVLVAGGQNNLGGYALASAELYDADDGPTSTLSVHAVPPTAVPPRIEPSSINDINIDAPLRLVPNETLLRNQPTVTGGLVADGVTPLLIELDSNPAPSQPTTFTFNTIVTGGTVAMMHNVNAYLYVLQQSGTPQFVPGDSVVVSSTHSSGFAYISGIRSDQVQFDPGSKELIITLTATQEGQSSPAATVPFKIRKPPIVLVHGYNSDNGAWYTDESLTSPNNFLATLRGTFPTDFILPIEYGVSRNGTTVDKHVNISGAFEYLAPLLDEQLRNQVESQQSSWHQQWAFTRYNIVGHSQGGVLARMLCTEDDPSPGVDPSDPNKFWKFRSPNNAQRGRFHRVITLNSPHNGSTLLRYLLDVRDQGYFVTSIIQLFGDLLQDKFDPFGSQILEINFDHWHIDPAAKFHLIATTIHSGNPPAVGDDLPLCYSETGLAGQVANQNYSRGWIVIPSGSDGVVDFTSEFAGSLFNRTSVIQGVDIAHSPPEWVFGVSVGNTVTANVTVANRVADLLSDVSDPSTQFGSFNLQRVDPSLAMQIDDLVPPVNVNGSLIQAYHPLAQGHQKPARFTGGTDFQFAIAPAPDQQPTGSPAWYAQVFGPNGVDSDGVAVTPDQNDPEIVTVTVDPNVVGDVLLYATYDDVNGHLITGAPVVVVSRPPGNNLEGIELIPNEIALTTGSRVESQIWADYDNQTRSQLYIPIGSMITYSSDNNAIASVDSGGAISLNSPGSTNIHVSYLGFSAQSSVIVSPPPPPPVIAALHAVSRKPHGDAGEFDIDLPFTGFPGIECRNGGVSGHYQIAVTFASPITAQSAVVTSGIGGVNNFTVNGSEIAVNLTGVENAQTVVITLLGVSNGTTTGDITVPMSVLVGDVNANGVVNASDVAQTKSRIGQPVDQTNFRFDVNASGSINGSDVSNTKSNVGTGLP